eukprot:COSAG02_NODE_7018_length_3224_cov_96.199360_4_plen_59_part_00
MAALKRLNRVRRNRGWRGGGLSLALSRLLSDRRQLSVSLWRMHRSWKASRRPHGRESL